LNSFLSADKLLIMPSRRLDDRIRMLCAKAASAEPAEVEAILRELKAALAEHTSRLRKLAARKLAGDGEFREKRFSPS
jgi:hypothetical protein